MKSISKISHILIIALIGVLTIGKANAIPVIDLDARVNGLSNPVDKLLAPGTYTVDAVGIAGGGTWDAWNAWGSTNCSDSNGCDRTGTTKYKGWLNSFGFSSTDLVDVFIDGVAATPTLGDLYKVNPKIAYPDALTALANAWSAEFTLNAMSLVSFAITDSHLTDNLGGMSLNVALKAAQEQSVDVPEPPSLALIVLAGLLGFGFTKRRKV